jgi:glucose/arabinose dehydrogenase
MRPLIHAAAFCALLLAGCRGDSAGNAANAGATPADSGANASTAARPACAPDNGGLTLPTGFCAVIVASGFSPEGTNARHIQVAPDGTIYASVQGKEGAETPSERGGVVAMRDTNGDGKIDTTAVFGPEGGTGLVLRDGMLYFATNTAILRYRMGAGLLPESGPDTLVQGLPAEPGHTSKSFALGNGNELWVDIGSPSNVCQQEDRAAGSKGKDPCPELETRAGVWRFAADKLHQTQAQGTRWATGIRNAVAVAFNPTDQSLYVVQHGRDQLNLWPPYTAEDNAERPAEEFLKVTEGSDFGWPYCWYDNQTKQRRLSPEYAGSGAGESRCASKDLPVVTFPGHLAPNDLLFYNAQQFPEHYRGGAFIAFHGSWNRAPLPQAGYRVDFVPFTGGKFSQSTETFANGFAGPDINNAQNRPVGLAVGPDGSLYIASSNSRVIWRVMYTG